MRVEVGWEVREDQTWDIYGARRTKVRYQVDGEWASGRSGCRRVPALGWPGPSGYNANVAILLLPSATTTDAAIYCLPWYLDPHCFDTPHRICALPLP